MIKYHVEIQFTANYFPQGNPIDRVHMVGKSMLTAYISEYHKKWDQYLGKITFPIRLTKLV